MKVIHYQEMEPAGVETEGAQGVSIRWLISKTDGAPHFAMRLFEVEPGGHSPLHTHESEHEVFIIKGEGSVWQEGRELPIKSGSAIYVPSGEKHQFRNTGGYVMQFICMVPNSAY